MKSQGSTGRVWFGVGDLVEIVETLGYLDVLAVSKTFRTPEQRAMDVKSRQNQALRS
jgi:hypothetical protein